MSDIAIFGGEPLRTKPFPEWPRSTDIILDKISSTLQNDTWGVGSNVINEFNSRFAELQNAKYSISVHSGTSALWVALKAGGVKAGDEVIIPAYTFIATATAVILANAVPVFADIDLNSGNIDPVKVDSLITKKTKAIIPVHIAGNPADMRALTNISEEHEIPIIEDAAQAHGAEYNGTKVGAIGLGGIFSFQTSKNMTAGEGGAIVTNDPEFFDACFSYHNCGRVRNGKWYEHHRLGSNLRMSALNAAVLIPQLDTLATDMVIRDRNREMLDASLSEIPGINPMASMDGSRSANHLYMCRYDASEFNGISRETFFKVMQAEGIYTYKGYSPLYQEPLFITDPDEYPWLKGRDYQDLELPNTERFANQEAVWLKQTYLLGNHDDTMDITRTFEKVTSAMQKEPQRFLELKSK